MAKKKKNNGWYIFGGIVILVLVLWIILANIENNKVICNRPYIQVGQSCCLDDNYNRICDNEESEPEPENNYKNFEVKAYITHDFARDIDDLPSFPSKDYTNYPIWDYGSATDKLYDAGSLYLYTDYEEEKVICYVKEFYDGNLNDQFTATIYYGGYYLAGVGYEKSDTPDVVRYDYECSGEDSGNKFLGAYMVHPTID